MADRPKRPHVPANKGRKLRHERDEHEKAEKAALREDGRKKQREKSYTQEIKRKKKPQQELDAYCKQLLEILRKTCPDLLPGSPLPAGQPGPDIQLNRKQISETVRRAGYRINEGLRKTIWSRAGNELDVNLSGLSVEMVPGFLRVHIPVSCDQTGEARILIRFAVGSQERPAGMIAATNVRPDGPPQIVEIWGEALVALAWGAVIEAMQKVAHFAGTDEDQAGLIPAALSVDSGRLHLQTMARHPMDRRQPWH